MSKPKPKTSMPHHIKLIQSPYITNYKPKYYTAGLTKIYRKDTPNQMKQSKCIRSVRLLMTIVIYHSN